MVAMMVETRVAKKVAQRAVNWVATRAAMLVGLKVVGMVEKLAAM